MKKEEYHTEVKFPIQLRCCKCDFEFDKLLDVNDRLDELECPNCHLKYVEVNLGRKRR